MKKAACEAEHDNHFGAPARKMFLRSNGRDSGLISLGNTAKNGADLHRLLLLKDVVGIKTPTSCPIALGRQC
ncbi:MAG TPA: hypothetical protein VIV82_02375, partial [Verrucomicrobiae bacterium]